MFGTNTIQSQPQGGLFQQVGANPSTPLFGQNSDTIANSTNKVQPSVFGQNQQQSTQYNVVTQNGSSPNIGCFPSNNNPNASNGAAQQPLFSFNQQQNGQQPQKSLFDQQNSGQNQRGLLLDNTTQKSSLFPINTTQQQQQQQPLFPLNQQQNVPQKSQLDWSNSSKNQGGLFPQISPNTLQQNAEIVQLKEQIAQMQEKIVGLEQKVNQQSAQQQQIELLEKGFQQLAKFCSSNFKGLCDNGHILEACSDFIVLQNVFCNVCKQNLANQNTTYRCKQCDFDRCSTCYINNRLV